ncbi:MAG: hypothetical protein A2X35_07970 [Elusimicrobia bacterium GWA2_61_42]|nr:MAG: hypothetical protein A2X35_07970 [Elusimicrobia bacterium GWA2_61_42]OGR76028.1 MAG: hypothetical protein A2X38_08280 [Elusimicrobia bacterium GWC2_61_25]
MKLLPLIAIAAVTAFSVNALAQAPANPAVPAVAPAVAAVPAKGMKITKISGVVNVMKNGVIVMTLKPGDAIPVITDNKMSFAVVNGAMELEVGGKTISAVTGSNFTVSTTDGQVNVALGAGAPVALKSESGHNVVLTPNSEIKMTTTKGNVEIVVEKGNAVVSNASGGETQAVKAGDTINIPLPPPAPSAGTPAPGVTVVPAPEDTSGTEPIENGDQTVVVIPPATVIPTQEAAQDAIVTEVPAVSESMP